MHPGQVPPLGTWTVKREMRIYLAALKERSPGLFAGLTLFRMDDGPEGMIAEMNINEVLEGK
jgi:hypothetical protein